MHGHLDVKETIKYVGVLKHSYMQTACLESADCTLENKTECLFTLNCIWQCGCRPGGVPNWWQVAAIL